MMTGTRLNPLLPRAAVAGGVALAVNALIFLGLVVLNRSQPPAPQEWPTVSLVRLPPAPPPPPPPLTLPAVPQTPTALHETAPPQPSVVSEAITAPDLHIDLFVATSQVSTVKVAPPQAIGSKVSIPTVPSNSSGTPGGSAHGSDASQGPAAVLDADGVDRGPRETLNPQPVYPRSLLRRGVEGEVRFRLLIDERGRVEQIDILDDAGQASFADAVREAASRWLFEPAQHHGRTVKVWATKTIRFQIQRQ